MKLSIISLLFTVVSLAQGDAVEQGQRALLLDTSMCGTGADQCCVGSYACTNAGNSGTATVKSRSCDGEKACQNAGQYSSGNASVEEDSCIGAYSCQNIGRRGTFSAAAGSCSGTRACSQGGRETAASLTVGPGSCIGPQRTCDGAGMRGSASIGSGSCIGDRSCLQMANRDSAGIASVGDGSCLGFQSCFLVASNDGEVHIGNNSCREKRSCRAIGRYAVEHEGIDVGPITIGNNSCNCEGCCGCLKAGDVVPDNMCNSLGDGETECCISVGDRNPFGPIGENNLCWDQNDKCRKATVSGDPHIRTFSGVRYDCMGQGEFILSQSISETDPLDIRGLFVDPQFAGEEDPWANDRSPQTVTRGVSFVVDPDVPRVTIKTDPINTEGHTCYLYYHIEGIGDVTRDQMLNDHTLLRRPDVRVTSRGPHDMRFKFGDYEADLSVRVSSTSRRWGCVVSFSSCLKDEYHGDVIGLFGTNNMYKNDDWTTPDGTQLIIPTNPRSRAARGAATDFCNTHWCYRGPVADSFFGADYTYYSRCDHSPYESHYDPDAFEAMLETITATCDEQEFEYNIPSEALYDTALEHHIRNESYDLCPVEEIEAMRILNEVAVFNCEREPDDNDPRPEIGGDPHITTWKNEHYEFHGQCDLVMLKDEDFADGLGLEVHIRTKLVRYWSYIQSVAIRIGNDIIEIEGTADVEDEEPHYWFNYEYQGEIDDFAGFPFIFKKQIAYKRQYIIDLSPKYPDKNITIQLFKEFIRVKLNGNEEVFGNTVGLLGDYRTGKTLARDGVTELHDYSALGDDWQVLPSDGILFRNAAHPQFPERCLEPEDPRGERKRRLSESTVLEEDAEKACASLKDPLAIKDCVYDVLATQDLDMVGAF